MGRRPSSGDGTGCNETQLVDDLLGNQHYQSVKAVSDQLTVIELLGANMAALQAVATAIAGGADFTPPHWGGINGTLSDQIDLQGIITGLNTAIAACLPKSGGTITGNLNVTGSLTQGGTGVSLVGHTHADLQPINSILSNISALSLVGRDGQVLKVSGSSIILANDNVAVAGTSATWGAISGSLSDQADLVSVLNTKVDSTYVTTAINSAVSTKVNSSLIGAANGIAPLGSDSKIAATYLPSYVDDVLEYANLAAFPGTGETGKIYVTDDTNKVYRWSGSSYIEISPSPGSTDAVPEGAGNKYFTNARAISAISGATLTSGLTINGGSLVLGNNANGFFLKDTGGSQPNLICQGDNNVVMYGTTSTGAAKGIWSYYARTDNPTFGVAVPMTVAGTISASGSITAQGAMLIDGAGTAARSLYFTAGGVYAGDLSINPDNATMSANITTAFQWKIQGTEQLRLQINGGLTVSCFDSSYNVGVKQSRTGQVGYHMYNGGGVAEWLMYQPAHTTADYWGLATWVGGSKVDRLTVDSAGNVNVVSGTLTVNTGEIHVYQAGNAGVIRMGPTDGSKYIYYDGTQFQFNGQVNTNGFTLVGGNILTTGANAGVVHYDRDNSGHNFLTYAQGNVFRIYSSTASLDKFTLDASGNGTFSGNITANSDRRLKSNIRRFKGASDIIAQLKAFRFTMWDQENFGLIAQDVKKVAPEIVIKGDKYLSLDYSRLTALLIDDNNVLRKRLEKLESLIEKLAV